MVKVRLTGEPLFTGCSLLAHLLPGRREHPGWCSAMRRLRAEHAVYGYGAHRALATELRPRSRLIVRGYARFGAVYDRHPCGKSRTGRGHFPAASLVAFGNLTDYDTNFLFV